MYLIINIVSKKYYIGSAKRFYARFSQHLSSLRQKKHYNSHLQNSFIKHGEDAFEFHVLEITASEDRTKTEQFYLNECFHDENCLNLNPIAQKYASTIKPKEELKRIYSREKSLEERQKISLSRLGKTGFQNKDKNYSLESQLVLQSVRNENIISLEIQNKELVEKELRERYNRWGKATEKQDRERKLLKEFMINNDLWIDHRRDSWLRKSEQHKKEAIEILLKGQERSPARIKGKIKKDKTAQQAQAA